MLNWLKVKLAGSNGDHDSVKFLGRLGEEAERSLRYNHFFTVAILASYRTSPDDIHDRVKTLLRQTDFVTVIDAESDEGTRKLRSRGGAGSRAARALKRQWVVAIFPETNREAANCVFRRLKGVLLSAHDVVWGFAVYPDDSTAPKELLKLAEPKNG
ncbi:hypothetical protein ACFL09_00545 [Planctomycetota bacterium]